MIGRRRNLILAAALLSLAGSVAARQAPPPSGSAAVEARNKQVVLDMWHDVIDGRNIANAPRYIAEDYIQHSPSAGQGRADLMAFLKKEFAGGVPRAAGSYPLTNFVFVIAEGDLVQLMFKRQLPAAHDPARLVDVWWYDTYRVKDGMIVEHWDSVQG